MNYIFAILAIAAMMFVELNASLQKLPAKHNPE
jgi:hypothetical protein